MLDVGVAPAVCALLLPGIFRRPGLSDSIRIKSPSVAHDGDLLQHYNFVRIHQTLKVTPAMAAGATSKLWEMSDMVKVLEDWEAA